MNGLAGRMLNRPGSDYTWAERLLVHEEWRDYAACLEFPPDMWFPEKDDPTQDAANARRICATCPVRNQCLEAGLPERYGIWGATTVSPPSSRNG